MHRKHGREERGNETHCEDRQVFHMQQRPVAVNVIHRGGKHGRDGEEKGKLGSRLAAEAENQAAHDCCTGTRDAWEHGHGLGEADFQRHLPGHLLDVIDTRVIGTFFQIQNDQAAGNKGAGNGDRIEQIELDGAVKQHAQHGSGQEGKQDMAAETARGGVVVEAADNFHQTGAIVPANRQDGGQLDDDLEYLALFVGVAQQAAGDDQVSGTGNGEKFGQAFDDAKQQGFKQERNIHDGTFMILQVSGLPQF
jgi:hypothetical protein